MELVFVRHAESTSNAEYRWQGQVDVHLSEKGFGQAKRVCERLSNHRFDRVFCSDLSRTRETLEPLGARDVEFDPRLREIRLGNWEGLLHAEVQERFPNELRALMTDDGFRPGGDGETQTEFNLRVQGVLGDIVRKSTGARRVLVVTHGGVIRSIVTRVLGLRGRRALVGARNTSLTRLSAEGETLRLAAYNCIDHLGEDSEGEVVHAGAGDLVERVVSHLGIAEARAHFVAPLPGTRTVLLHEPERQLRAFAVPAL